MLEKDISTFMQRRPNGMLLVHVDEHRSMCPDPHFRRGAMRVLAELPGHRHSTPPSRSLQKLADDPSHVTRCGDNHEGAPAHGRHRHGE